MFTHNTGVCVVENDELYRLVDPAVSQADRNAIFDVSVPESPAVVDGVIGLRIFKRDDKGGRVDVFQNFSVDRRRAELDEILGW